MAGNPHALKHHLKTAITKHAEAMARRAAAAAAREQLADQAAAADAKAVAAAAADLHEQAQTASVPAYLELGSQS